MMNMKYFYTGILAVLFSLAFVGCDDDIDPLVEEITLSRVLSPEGLEARIRNRTTIELAWETRDEVDHYVVEFSEDSLEFGSIVRTVTVSPGDIPLQETFFGNTRYSARIKGVSAEGVADSKWTAVTIKTDTENIFSPVVNGDIASLEATLKWPANSEVTHFTINPGAVNRTISAEEKSAGSAVITGLNGRTNYTINLYSGNSQRGSVQFTTLVDPAGVNTLEVFPEDDLSAVIAGAAAGSTLVLHPGDYTAYTGEVIINKDIEIVGFYPYNKPKVHVQFTIESGVGSVKVTDLDISGDATLDDAFDYNTPGVEFGTLEIRGCNIHDFTRTFIRGNVASKVTSVTVDNSIVTDILTSGGDFVDFRTTYLANLTITNSTFDNCAPARDFLRIDAAAGYSGTGLTTNVLIDHCTIFGASTNSTVSNRRVLYVRFATNVVTVKNTIIAESTGFYTNQTGTSQPVCDKNNYFNAARFYDASVETLANLKVDASGTHTTLDPGFANTANGDFTVSNQTLKDNKIGDPRWLQ